MKDQASASGRVLDQYSHVSAYERVWRGTGVMEPLNAREVQASSIVAGGTREGTIPAG